MSNSHLLVEHDEGLITVTINRPGWDNRLNKEVLCELHTAILEATWTTPTPRALILTGSGSRFFAGGLDPGELTGMDPVGGGVMSALGQDVCNELEKAPFPTIAAVNGVAAGSGCELVLACDIAIASSAAKFAFPEVAVGLLPGFGGTVRLARRVGTMRARFMIFTAQPVDVATAVNWGLVHEAVPPEQLMVRCREIAAAISGNAAGAVAEAKRMIVSGADLTIATSNALEGRAFAARFGTEEMKMRLGEVGAQHPAWWPEPEIVG